MPHIARCPKAVEGCGERASGFDASVTHQIGYHHSGTLLRGCLGPDMAGALRQDVSGSRDCGDCGFPTTTTTCITYSRILVYHVYNVLVGADNLETSACSRGCRRVCNDCLWRRILGSVSRLTGKPHITPRQVFRNVSVNPSKT
jgi:hypothetical protein